MTKLSRRAMFPLFAAGGIAAADGAQGATLDTLPGIVARIAKTNQGWCILVPDYDSMSGYWRPGMVVPTQWMPIADYFKLIDETYSMRGLDGDTKTNA